MVIKGAYVCRHLDYNYKADVENKILYYRTEEIVDWERVPITKEHFETCCEWYNPGGRVPC